MHITLRILFNSRRYPTFNANLAGFVPLLLLFRSILSPLIQLKDIKELQLSMPNSWNKTAKTWLTSAVEWFGYRAFINWCRQYRTVTTWKWKQNRANNFFLLFIRCCDLNDRLKFGWCLAHFLPYLTPSSSLTTTFRSISVNWMCKSDSFVSCNVPFDQFYRFFFFCRVIWFVCL